MNVSAVAAAISEAVPASNVRGVLQAAVRDRVISTNPSQGVTLPRRRRAEAAMTLPTTDQVRALLDNAADVFSAFVALCAFAGLRLGKAAAPRGRHRLPSPHAHGAAAGAAGQRREGGHPPSQVRQ